MLDGRRSVLGEEHPDTLVSIINLATLYHVQTKYGVAEPLYKSAFNIQKRKLGESHPDTLEVCVYTTTTTLLQIFINFQTIKTLTPMKYTSFLVHELVGSVEQSDEEI